MPSYLAITIGPIYKTMSLAKKTRELWSVSFTFSRLMKHLIDAFSVHGKLISPGLIVKQPLHGAGVFPDRCFFILNRKLLSEKEIETSKDTAFQSFSKETGIKKADKYYQVYLVQAELASQPVSELNRMLDALELQQNYSPKQILNWNEYWSNPDKRISKDYFQHLYTLGFEQFDDLLPDLIVNKSFSIRRFPSIPEISTNEFAKQDLERYWSAIGYQGIKTSGKLKPFTRFINQSIGEEIDDDDLILLRIKEEFPDKFLFRHKYFSVVLADGDSVGTLLKEIEKKGGNLNQLSGLLNSFTEKATELLVKYGAFPVYMGGDDLFFFAPLANNNINDLFFYPSTAHGNIFGNNLFFLLSKLNSVFQAELQPVVSQYKINVSLSFGVMCGYYKQPLHEIMETSYSNLFYNAKKQPGKNYITMEVQKHSGQSFHLGFKQTGPLYEAFLKLSHEATNKDSSFLNSVMYKLDDQKAVLELISDYPDRLAVFFRENFNEALHKNYTQFFEATGQIINGVFSEFKHINLEDKMEKIYGALRFVHFINAKDVSE